VPERTWPSWWDWELEFTPHIIKRTVDRRFSEIDLRAMLENARGYRPDILDNTGMPLGIHHRLLDMGVTHRKAVLFLYVFSILFAAGAIALATGCRFWV